MKKIEEGDRVKYIGSSNRWTFKQDLEKNSICTVLEISNQDGKINCQVEFENGIITIIDINELKHQ